MEVHVGFIPERILFCVANFIFCSEKKNRWSFFREFQTKKATFFTQGGECTAHEDSTNEVSYSNGLVLIAVSVSFTGRYLGAHGFHLSVLSF